jgi:glycosyltransferase involved in cell wall biosynthesis
MRIAQLVSARHMNGAARHCLTLSLALAERGHRVLLAHRPGLAPMIEHPLLECFETGFERTPAALARIDRRLRDFGAEVLQTHMSSAHSYGALLKLWRGAPLVATAHSRHFQLHWMLNDRVIAPSRSTAAYHRRVNLRFGPFPDVIPNFVDAARITPPSVEQRAAARRALGVSSEALVIGSVAEVRADKRPSDLVEAARPLLERRRDAVLVLIGELMERAEVDRVRRAASGVAHRVKLLGRREDAHRLLAGLDLFALASVREEAPMSILEAMATGLPVVAADVGGLGELVVSGETGFLVEPGDVATFRERLERLAQDEALRLRLGEAARCRLVQEFDQAPIVCRIEAVLESAAVARAARARRVRLQPVAQGADLR